MEFRNLKKQYEVLKEDIDKSIQEVLEQSNFISGKQVAELENMLAKYVGVKHCISCANGTDAITLALMAWNIGAGDAVFVPDFTFFSSGECPAYEGATPIFVDVYEDTFNISSESLENAIVSVINEGKLTPKVIVTVDLFGLPANYDEIKKIADKYNLLILEDGAQGFGGEFNGKKACSFGDISTTSFFPAKPLGCYGDGGAIFTNDDHIAELIKSYRVHGKGEDKYDNVRFGMNSRLDTIQAAILKVKLKAFEENELYDVNKIADRYTEKLKNTVKCPSVSDGFMSSWAQYSILLKNKDQRNGLQAHLKGNDIPSMIYYRKPMHTQKAFKDFSCVHTNLDVTTNICDRVLSLPIHPYLSQEEQDLVIEAVREYIWRRSVKDK